MFIKNIYINIHLDKSNLLTEKLCILIYRIILDTVLKLNFFINSSLKKQFVNKSFKALKLFYE